MPQRAAAKNTSIKNILKAVHNLLAKIFLFLAFKRFLVFFDLAISTDLQVSAVEYYFYKVVEIYTCRFCSHGDQACRSHPRHSIELKDIRDVFLIKDEVDPGYAKT